MYELRKWNEIKMKKWSSEWTQFMQLRKEAWKKSRTATGFEPLTSLLPVRCSTNWVMKPLTLGAGQFLSQEHMNPQLTCSLRQWFQNSVGRASYRQSRGHGFKPRWSPGFFSGFFTQLHKLRSLRRSFLHLQKYSSKLNHSLQNSGYKSYLSKNNESIQLLI